MVQLCIETNHLPGFIVKAELPKVKLEADWLPCTAAPHFAFSSYSNEPQCVLLLSVVSFKYESRGTGRNIRDFTQRKQYKENRILSHTSTWYSRHI